MNISAKDKATGKEQSIKIEASSGLTEEEIERMKREAQENAEADKKKKEKIDKLNAADALIFQVEKQLKENGDKMSADKKAEVESALADLKKAHEAKDFGTLDSATEKLNTVFQAAAAEMHQQAGADNAQPGGQETAENTENAEAEDVDFEEVD